MRLLAALLLCSLPLTATAQGFATRPGSESAQGGMVLPQNGTPAPAPVPQAPPAPPMPSGQFSPIEMTPPTLQSLMRTRSIALNRTDSRDLGTQSWGYAAYEPGGSGPRPNRAIIVLTPPGIQPTQALESLDLRPLAREGGWRLLVLPLPQTARVQAGTLSDIAEAQRASANDGERIDRILSALLAQEQAPQGPALIANEGAGNGLLALLCARTGRSPAPSAAVVLGGTLDAATAAACQPSRVPALLIARSTSDTGVPYGGGKQPTLPGQAQRQSDTVLSAPGTRGFWAALARCRQTEPTLRWLELPGMTGRTALETHGNCSAGGPVALLTAMDGAQLPTGESLVALVGQFLGGQLLQ